MKKENAKEKKKNRLKEAVDKLNSYVTGDVLANLAYSSMIMIYFMFFNILYETVSQEILLNYINVSSLVFLLIGIFIIEVAYKKDNGITAIYGIEFLVLATFTLLIRHMPKLFGCSTQTYVLIGSYLFAIYYMLKSAVLYTREKQELLNRLSDIKEIVKEEPVKKVTRRRNKKTETTKKKKEEEKIK